MVWSKIASVDNKPRFLRKVGGVVYVTKNKKIANCDSVPEGWIVADINGHLVCKRK